MATIVNERDALLQGTTPRVVDVTLPENIVVPALKGLSITAPALAFRVANNGDASPTTIAITVNLQEIPADTPITWAVTSGTATLTGSGLSVSLAYANMASDFVTIKASATVGGLTYSDSLSFMKVTDGSIGLPGSRGSLSVARAITGSTWSDAEALTALQAAGATAPVATDTCTLFDVSAGYSEMRRYSGSAWVVVGQSIPGSVLMKQSVTTEQLLVTGLGIALNSDPNTVDLSAWSGSGISVVADTTAPNGTSALRCTATGVTVLSKQFPISEAENYRVQTWAKQESGTSTTYLTVAFYDAAGAVLTGTANPTGWGTVGTFHYFGLVNATMPGSWTQYEASFGPGETRKIPAGAKFVAIGLLSNYTGTGVQRISGMRCHLKTSGAMVVDGSITAGKIDARGLAIKDASGNVILGAGSALDWSMVGGTSKPADGATRNVFRGAWATGTVYAAGDTVSVSGSTWTALVAHTSANGTNNPPTLPTTSNTWWTLLASKGDTGAAGVNGTRTAILEMYQWAASAPTAFPSGSSTYTWATGQFTAPATTNGWSLTPPAPVVGQTLWTCRTIFADSLTTTTSSVTWNATSATPAGASGSNGAAGANGTRTAILELYRWSATTPSTFPAGSSTYTWSTGAFTAPATLNGWSLTPGAAVAGQTLWGCTTTYTDTGTSATSAVTWSATSAYALGAAGSDGATGAPGAAGASAVSAVLSNEAHVFPAASDGTVSTYAGSGTEVRVYEGATELLYDGVGTSNGTWKVTTAVTNITCGTLTDSGTFLTVGQHSGVANGIDTASITYTITGKTQAGADFTLMKVQTFAKSKQGVMGLDGEGGSFGLQKKFKLGSATENYLSVTNATFTSNATYSTVTHTASGTLVFTGPGTAGHSVLTGGLRTGAFAIRARRVSGPGTWVGSVAVMQMRSIGPGQYIPIYSNHVFTAPKDPSKWFTLFVDATKDTNWDSGAAIKTITITLFNGANEVYDLEFLAFCANQPATVGAPPGTYVGDVLAENLKNTAYGALQKSGDAITGPVTFATNGGILAATDADNGVFMGPNGLVGKKAGDTTFAIDTSGNASFGGTLNAASGTFAGTLNASAINAVNTINIANNAVTVPVSAVFSGASTYPTNDQTVDIVTTVPSDFGGASVAIFATVTCTISGGNAYLYGPGIEVIRDGVTVAVPRMRGWVGYSDGNPVISGSVCSGLDSPGVGPHTYTVRLYFPGNISGRTYTVSHVSITAIGVKK